NAAVPKEIAAVVLKALAKDPAERYQTATDLDAALVQAADRARSVKTEPIPASFNIELPGQLNVQFAPDPVFASSTVSRLEPELSAEDLSDLLVEEPSLEITKKHILIGGAAGAFVGALLMSIWLMIR